MKKILYVLIFIGLLGLTGFGQNKIESLNGIEFSLACCKICKKGKACGDSCIAKDYKCTKPKGCACNG